MKQIAKLQARICTVFLDERGVTLTLETVMMLILVILGMSALWVVVVKYVIGGEESIGFFGMTKSILDDLFQGG